MSFSVEATYENGFLKLAKPLPLAEHEKVRVTIEPERGWGERTAAMLQWTGDFEDLRRIAEDDGFGTREAVTVQPKNNWVQETAGILGWKGSPELAERFAMDPDLDYPPPTEGQ